MLKQRPTVYLALVAAFGGLLLAGAPADRLLVIGFVALMLMMHTGHQSHGGHGQGGRQGPGAHEDPVRQRHVASAPKEDEVAGK